MRWFFFGSLMDIDICEVVIAKRLRDKDIQPATLHGHVRVTVANETYPALKTQPGGAVAGILVDHLNAEDARRICFFEGEEFTLEPRTVELASGEHTEAMVFIAAAHLKIVERPWDFAVWQAIHKPHYLSLVHDWMAGYGAMDFMELDAQWVVNQTRMLQRRRTG